MNGHLIYGRVSSIEVKINDVSRSFSSPFSCITQNTFQCRLFSITLSFVFFIFEKIITFIFLIPAVRVLINVFFVWFINQSFMSAFIFIIGFIPLAILLFFSTRIGHNRKVCLSSRPFLNMFPFDSFTITNLLFVIIVMPDSLSFLIL